MGGFLFWLGFGVFGRVAFAWGLVFFYLGCWLVLDFVGVLGWVGLGLGLLFSTCVWGLLLFMLCFCLWFWCVCLVIW